MPVFLLLLLFACSGNEDGPLQPSEGKVLVLFSLSLPEPEDVEMRAAYGDAEIKNMTVLVFNESQQLIERIDVDEANITVVSADMIKFSIILDATPNNRTVHLIANARTADGLTARVNFPALTPGMAESAIVPALQTIPPGGTGPTAWIDGVLPLVMWGRVLLNGVSVTSTASVKLLRSVACVQVEKNATGSGLALLTLNRISILDGSDRGNVAPSAYTTIAATPPLNGGNPAATAGTTGYATAWTPAGEWTTYIYERNFSGSNFLSVILDATYNGVPGYYRIALARNETPLNVVRNHRYRVRILSVDAPGFANVQDAVNAAPSNSLRVEILDTHEDYPLIVADGQHWIGVDCNSVRVLYPQSLPSGAVQLCTLYSTRGIQPQINAAGPMSSSTFNVDPLGGNRYAVEATLPSPYTPGAGFTMKCDNLLAYLPVEWGALQSLGASDADSYVIDLSSGLDNWTVWVPERSDGTKMLHLHPTDGSPSALTGNMGGGMLPELSSKFFSHAYLHINASPGRQDVAIISSAIQPGGTVSYCKVVIIQ